MQLFDVIATFGVLLANQTSYCSELKAPGHIHFISSRQRADDHVRLHIADLVEVLDVPTTLHGC
jgi:hypothetical protein